MDASRRMSLHRREQFPPQKGIDLLIVDEIHRMIGRSGDILRRRFGLALSTIAGALVGLSATPVQLEVSDLKRVMDVVNPGLLDDETFPREIAATALLNRVGNLLGRLKWGADEEEELDRVLNELEETARLLSREEGGRVGRFVHSARGEAGRDVGVRHLLREKSLGLTLIQQYTCRSRAEEVGELRKRDVLDESVALDVQQRAAIQDGKMVSISEHSMYESLDRFLAQSFSFAHRRQLASCLPAMIDLMRLGMSGFSSWEAREPDEDSSHAEPPLLSERARKACTEFVDLYGLLPRDTTRGSLRRILER